MYEKECLSICKHHMIEFIQLHCLCSYGQVSTQKNSLLIVAAEGQQKACVSRIKSKHDIAMSTQRNPGLVASVNNLSKQEFFNRYIKSNLEPVKLNNGCVMTFETSTSLSTVEFAACLDLVSTTSSAAYKASSKGWSKRDKAREMHDRDMKYLLLGTTIQSLGSTESPVLADTSARTCCQGYCSFMVTREDDVDVLYCYEIHVQPELQGHGAGTTLMQMLELIGRNIGVQKLMLTVFTSNDGAVRFYERVGFVWYDEEPALPARRLRTGFTRETKPSYVILAKDLS